MKLMKGLMMPLMAALCLTACANQALVSEPASPKELGYDISREMIPKTVLEDSEFSDSKTFYQPDLYGDFVMVGAYWHDYLGDELHPVAVLQAVPAGTIMIKQLSGEIPVSDWEQYRIFEDKEVIIYDLYPMLYPDETMPQKIYREVEQTYYQTQEEYQAGKIEQDKYINQPLHSRLTQTRYLNYLWDYYKANLPELIAKMPNG